MSPKISDKKKRVETLIDTKIYFSEIKKSGEDLWRPPLFTFLRTFYLLTFTIDLHELTENPLD